MAAARRYLHTESSGNVPPFKDCCHHALVFSPSKHGSGISIIVYDNNNNNGRSILKLNIRIRVAGRFRRGALMYNINVLTSYATRLTHLTKLFINMNLNYIHGVIIYYYIIVLRIVVVTKGTKQNSCKKKTHLYMI